VNLARSAVIAANRTTGAQLSQPPGARPSFPATRIGAGTDDVAAHPAQTPAHEFVAGRRFLMSTARRTMTTLLAAAVTSFALVAGAGAGSSVQVPTRASLDSLHDQIGMWLVRNDFANFHAAEIMAFSDNTYVAVQGPNGKDAFELLVSPRLGWVMEEPPSMMWNTKYGMLGGLAGSFGPMAIMGGGMIGPGMMSGSPWAYDGPITPVKSLAHAVKIANGWLARVFPAVRAESTGRTFPGYYTIDTLKNGKLEGMLSVNARTGQVWYHGWHGTFLVEVEY
jgi:hypothetical protein